MRIFLVVSPPVGRMQGRSRSLTHMDALETETVFRDPIGPEQLLSTDSPRVVVSPPLHIRRQKLARSQVSSSEYFSVTFDVGIDNDPDEFVVAAKGTSLADALTPVCSRRGINLSSVNVYLDAYKTPLPVLTTDTSWLGGKHILIKGKSGTTKSVIKSTNSCPLRRKSGSYHSRGSRFFSVSSDEPSTVNDGSDKPYHKPSKQRWSNLFGNSKFQDSKMEQLIELLNSYSKHGIPQLQSVDEELEEALYNLEDNWRDIVRDSGMLMERQQQQQTAIWELVETEVTYIHTLRVLTDLFLACLCNLQSNNLLSEIDKNRLFGNILEIYAANRHFWCQYLLPMLAQSRETGKPMNPALLSDGFFKQFDELFYPYTKYCAEQSHCQQYCKEKHNENELFTAYLVWCETQKDCNRLRLMDILVKPMQRITKYSLLLKAIQKHTDIEEHKLKLDQMICRVDIFVNNVNTTLRYKQEFERLWVVISKIETYDVVDSKDEDFDRIIKSYNDLDLTCPMPGCCNSQRRFLLLEGDLKLKECNGTKFDVHCFLFTDLLLVCKATSKKSDGRFRVFKQPYIVERLMIHELPKDPSFLAVIYLTEYKVPATAFSLTCSDYKSLKTWASSIKKAQELYSTAKQATTATLVNPSLLALSRQHSSAYDEEWTEADIDHECESHSLTSTNQYTLKSPRGSSKGSSLNHSHSGSVDLNEAGSSVSSISQSRGISVENELAALRGSSQSSDEGMSTIGVGDRCNTRTLVHRRKCPSPNTLSIQVPVFSHLGQSLPNLTQVSTTVSNPPSNMLLAPPKGVPPRGTSYPPPSPPLRRTPALTFNRNPPLQKIRHISGSQTSSVAVSCDNDCLTNAMQDSTNQKPSLMKRLTRNDNKRYHTTGIVDDIKKQDIKENKISKRFSWNCGKRTKQQPHFISRNSTSSASSFGSCDPVSRNSSSSSGDFGSISGPFENLSFNEPIPESCISTEITSPKEEPSIPKTTVTCATQVDQAPGQKKKTTIQVLDEIDQKIKSIEEFQKKTEQKFRRIIGKLIVSSIVIYAVALCGYYYYFSPDTFRENILKFVPLLVFPIVIFMSRRTLSWYYRRKLAKNETALKSLKQKKVEILDEVTETEKYKAAKEIFEKYAPERLNPNLGKSVISNGNSKAVALAFQTPSRTDSAARQRLTPGVVSRRFDSAAPTPMPKLSEEVVPYNRGLAQPRLSLPRPILPRDRGPFDKLVDMLIGDGPGNRYALICRMCSSHNGMALKHEFEYISFRCAYCMQWNPARKQKPQAPHLALENVSHDESDANNSDPDNTEYANLASESQHKNGDVGIKSESSVEEETNESMELSETPASSQIPVSAGAEDETEDLSPEITPTKDIQLSPVEDTGIQHSPAEDTGPELHLAEDTSPQISASKDTSSPIAATSEGIDLSDVRKAIEDLEGESSKHSDTGQDTSLEPGTS